MFDSIKRLAYTSIYRYHFFRKLLHPNEGFHHSLIDCVDLLPIGLCVCPRNLQGILVAEAVVDECKVVSQFPCDGCPGMSRCIEGEVLHLCLVLPSPQIGIDLLVACMLLLLSCGVPAATTHHHLPPGASQCTEQSAEESAPSSLRHPPFSLPSSPSCISMYPLAPEWRYRSARFAPMSEGHKERINGNPHAWIIRLRHDHPSE